jgi:DNA-binding NtrC family response regulator
VRTPQPEAYSEGPHRAQAPDGESEFVYFMLVIAPSLATSEEIARALHGLPVSLLRAGTLTEGVSFYRNSLPQMIFLDSSLDNPAIQVHELFAGDSTLEVVLMTEHWNHAEVEQAIKRGASDLLAKPLESSKVRQLVDRFVEQAQIRRRTHELDNELLKAYQFQGIVGRSPEMLQVFSRVRRVAPLFQTALITGSTGTGKELIARALHNLSSRAQARFVVCNCSALVETLLESQLFGHVRGAFTGAANDKAGLFEYADHGTIFLDEIGELPLTAQAKLLRTLQNQELQRVGSPETHTVDVNVIAATNRNLREMVANGKFREDLFYRLSMIEIDLPSLVDRKEDLPLLQQYFLHKFSVKYAKKLKGISRRAQILLHRHSWPGNVRELENVIGNACMMTECDIVRDSDLPEALRRETPRVDENGFLTLEEVQFRHVVNVLKSVDGNKARAAEILGVSRATVYSLLARRSRPASPAANSQASSQASSGG